MTAPVMPVGLAPWSWRAATEADNDFLDALYASTRRDEVRDWGFGEEQATAFLRDQARLQRRSLVITHPRARHLILTRDGRPAGQMVLAGDAGSATTAIVDVTVLPEDRGRGLGAWALGRVLEHARLEGRRVDLRVDETNPARRLYERLGFRVVRVEDGRVHMTWAAPC